ncbi:MAG: FkbM family methyltransferase [Magnetococcales bacterium]|nr:FkbM family methyltransferase [Magnetococcales bacterium]
MPASLLLERLAVDQPTTIVDVGANPTDPTAHYQPLLQLGRCRLIGFEPQSDALDRLNRDKSPYETYYHHIIGDGGVHALHVCRAPIMTSILEPNQKHCQAFHLFDKFTEVIERQPVVTRTMDELDEIPLIDHLKINACGSERMILAHGKRKLAEVAVVQLEVVFIPLYHHQPTIGELDGELRSMGLIPHAFSSIKKWGVKPLIINNDLRASLNQLLVAEMVYVANFLDMESLSDERLKQMVILLHYCYQSYDVVLCCLTELARRNIIDKNPDEWYLAFVKHELETCR